MAIGESPSRIARAARYDIGDVLRYSRASKETGIAKGTYAHISTVSWLVAVRGVSVFREEIRSFSVGDCIQFTVPANELKIANRELGTIEAIDGAGRLNLKMDSGRSLQIDPRSQ
jgi:hypothetical protein